MSIIKYIVVETMSFCIKIPRGLTARIAGFHPAGPGSTPGGGSQNFFLIRSFIDRRYKPLIKALTILHSPQVSTSLPKVGISLCF